MRLRYEDISEILKIIDSSSCDEFLLETEDIKLVVRRRGANGPIPSVSTQPLAPSAPVSADSDPPAAHTPALQSAASAAPSPTGDEGRHVVRAPMVGTFYRAPSPGQPPFVDIGAAVQEGDPLCIIEVMKLFTTIYADRGGTVVEIGANDSEPVEYGQALFVIETD
jgi:acetyl-CoA carboxylase biotin carboxyl carrier protein